MLHFGTATVCSYSVDTHSDARRSREMQGAPYAEGLRDASDSIRSIPNGWVRSVRKF